MQMRPEYVKCTVFGPQLACCIVYKKFRVVTSFYSAYHSYQFLLKSVVLSLLFYEKNF